MRRGALGIAMAALFLVMVVPQFAQLPGAAIDGNPMVVLYGNTPGFARPENDLGATDPSGFMEHMILTLSLSPDKMAALDRFLAEQQNPASPKFRHWITSDEFSTQFGRTPEEIKTVTRWLKTKGFTVEEIGKGRTWINFSGTVAQVQDAFHTPIRNYLVDGRAYYANTGDPAIPKELSGLVGGVVSLNNYPLSPMHTPPVPVSRAEYNDGDRHSLSPGDFATIYNVTPLYNMGLTGRGVTIAVVGRTHPPDAGWAMFRNMMALPGNPPNVITNGQDPGDLGPEEDTEADLDVEWSGAIARDATIQFVVSKSTATDGAYLSAQYIVNNDVAPIVSMSFGLCESAMGAAGNSFIHNLWAQAAAQGMTVFVSSGDEGSSACNEGKDTTGSGLAINGLASTPYNIAVGGTEFDEGYATYFWSPNNGPGYTSALRYIPEIAWNESGAASFCPSDVTCQGLWATGGGASTIWPKPSWQVCKNVPFDGMRDVPDVSLTAANHDGYLIWTQGALNYVGGTSASAPSLAGLMALIVQKTGQRQGNANFRLYQLANDQYSNGGAAVYHDVTSGNNSVPGVSGYNCGVGYDLATGLGSVDAAALATNWAAGQVWAWGANYRGCFGNGTTTGSNVPVLVPFLPGVAQIAAGGSFSLFLMKDGTVWAAGLNDIGQLGNGSYTDSSTPVKVSNLNNVVSISAGWDYALALKNDGTVWAWGTNNSGQLGNGTTTTSNVPVQVLNLSDAMAVSAGKTSKYGFCIALKNDETVWAWGDNAGGQLGIGTSGWSSNSTVPVQVLNLASIIAISAGSQHSLALGSTGTLWAWGGCYLGDGTYMWYHTVPVQIPNLAEISAIEAGTDASYIIRKDGTLWAWGTNYYGELGIGGYNEAYVPTRVPNLSGVVAVSHNNGNGLAIKNDGTLWAWGWNGDGTLGNGTNSDSDLPVQATGLNGATMVSKGGNHCLAIANAAFGCNLSCSASGPTSGALGSPVSFSGMASASACIGSPTYDWNFGDGTADTYGQAPTHTYTSPGTYTWTLTASADGRTCDKAGTILISALTPPTIASLTKVGSPFRITVTGSNLQTGMKVFINGAQWTSVSYKSTSKIVLAGGSALKAKVPKGVPTDFSFANPDGGSATKIGWSW